MKVANEIASSKDIRIKNNTYKWFDREFAELIHALGKFILKFKNQSFTFMKKFTKKVNYQVQIFIRKKEKIL